MSDRVQRLTTSHQAEASPLRPGFILLAPLRGANIHIFNSPHDLANENSVAGSDHITFITTEPSKILKY